MAGSPAYYRPSGRSPSVSTQGRPGQPRPVPAPPPAPAPPVAEQAAPPPQPVANPARWRRYFDELEVALHDFEVGLSRGRVVALAEVEIPPGHPPDELRGRSGDLYMRVTELEFRARYLREEIRAESARLPRSRTRSGKADWNYGSALDINT